MSKILITVTSTLLSSLGVYLFTEFSDFVYGNFIGIILAVTIGCVAILTTFTVIGFSRADKQFSVMRKSALRSHTMLFCNFMFEKKHISSSDVAYLYRLREDCAKDGINGYVSATIDSVIEKYSAQSKYNNWQCLKS